MSAEQTRGAVGDEPLVSDQRSSGKPTDQTKFGSRAIMLAALPLLLLAGVIALIIATAAGLGSRGVPPIETLNIQQVRLPEPGLVELEVVNDGPDPITIAQVLVDEAYWQFAIEPAGTLDRLASATISIPYPWVADEGHS
ncbi:MAG: hypothetical protein M3R06_10110, partial [Chloroflexota bacterium]|nr:hypothetical protein [Chloroflexota bacterium]